MEQSAESKYRCAFERGRPEHGPYDEFSLRHPKMQPGQRAKIFAPFSALKGFEEAIEEKLERYVDRRELSEEERERLDRALTELHGLTRNLRLARQNRVRAAVTYFRPCTDENHEAYGRRGTYETLTGLVWKVDPVLTRSLLIGDRQIEFSDLAVIEIIAPTEET